MKKIITLFFLIALLSLVGCTKINPSTPVNSNSIDVSVQCKENLDCPSQKKCEDSNCVDVGCVSEGLSLPGAISPDYLEHLPQTCCEGLSKIDYEKNYDENCNQIGLVGGPSGICSYCGNNKCEEWETKCTCPEDCIKNPQPPLNNNSSIDLSNCTVYFDGCNDCQVSEGEILKCTKRNCGRYEEPKCTKYKEGYSEIDLTNCLTYYNGCNVCGVENGILNTCTLMKCDTYEEPKCIKYKE